MSGGRRGPTLVAMCLAQAMILLDVTIVNVALPSIQRELSLSPGNLEWVISAYALALATLIPLGGALADRFGRKRVFLAGLAIFTVSSAGCALSTTDVALIGARAVQGAGGALMAALTLSLLVEAFPPERRAWAIGTWAGVGGLGFGAGPIVGGILLGAFDWSSIFWVNVPIGIVGAVVTVAGVAESRDPAARHLDIAGVALSALGLFGITLALIESSTQGWGSSAVVGLMAVGVVALVAFAIWERHSASPMVPTVLAHDRVFLAANSVFALSYLALTGSLFYVTLYYQNVRGWSALRTGLSWIPLNLPFLVVAELAGRIGARFRRDAVIATGTVIAALGVLGLSRLGADSPYALAVVAYLCVGLGFGILVPACSTVAMSEVPPGASGIASGLLNTSRQIGTSVGLAVLGSIGVGLAVHDWNHRIAALPANIRSRAAGLASDVAGGQIETVARSLGAGARQDAVASFLHGYQGAMTVGGVALLAAALLGGLGLRRRPISTTADAAAPIDDQ
jgi:EmrB/QacA subfamily drug resistance transporter